jgi:putative component of membrane protein insertase Oxa1/YidC/SpoIIIJ protein YidD
VIAIFPTFSTVPSASTYTHHNKLIDRSSLVIASMMAFENAKKCEPGASHQYHLNPDIDPLENVGSIFS